MSGIFDDIVAGVRRNDATSAATDSCDCAPGSMPAGCSASSCQGWREPVLRGPRPQEPTLDCQQCGQILRYLSADETRRVAADPYAFVALCPECTTG